uniref:Uncharacterized protein n=1 Tax=Oryzias sinensis TaxID=183150 RepID=A0A8C7X3H8_9TELE
MEAIKESHSSKKRSPDCPPTPVNIGTPVKKKKKEKETVSPSSDVSANHKKKSKKERRAEEEVFNPLSDSDEVIDSHKKKRTKEVSITYPGDEQVGKKKKKKNLRDDPEKERSETEKEKSRNDAESLNKEAVEASVSKHRDSSIITAGNNSKEKKKKKKKKKDGSDVEGSSQEGEAPKHRKTKQASIAMATGRVNNETDVAVSLETSVSSSTQKKDGIGGKSEKEEAAAEETKSEQSSSRNQSLSLTKELDLNLISELEEFVPDVRNKSAHEIMKLVRYDLHRFKDFKRQGVPLRCGRYTDWENGQIQKNVADFAALTDIGSAEQVLFPQRFKEQAAEIRSCGSYQRVWFVLAAEGIPRPCHQVYTRARKIFDHRNHMGRSELKFWSDYGPAL